MTQPASTPPITPDVTELALRRWRRAALGFAWLSVLLAATLALTWRRASAFEQLIDGHLELQAQLQHLEQKMIEVDRILLRLRLYDAQLESLGEPKGDAGPLPVESYSNASWPQEPLDDAGLEPDVEFVSGLRPTDEWADGIEARVETFLEAFVEREQGLSRMVTELESLEALERSLPSFWPARAVLTSGYGWRRDPFIRRWSFHSGVDFGGQTGDPIYAAAQGKVVLAEAHPGYGRHIVIDHGYGVRTLYGHCHRLMVKAGDLVRRGQKIGLMGSTGRSTGPHLHFEVHLDETKVDPLQYLRRNRRARASGEVPSP
jgi:murein DD-endopeptidase MepM/ murein hydrolase activator NlpD